ncbi:hypothetical protein DRW48_14295 [Paracoccus suum]|uniref:Lipoprotein n=1 Tax=Paracoccus suum TaxID=2259340 RepID=A0A344PMU1_9RHOB|nr:hypothetical protein [Paracoccus suum]AXC50696.1 hypothetical protein DRW48_14295 [Paracoccus suum]
MPRNRTMLPMALALVAALGACGTPKEQCVSRNTQEYRTLARLLAEVEGNLARGYAWDERPVTTTEWRECRDVVRGRDGRPVVIPRPCLRDVTEMERFRVPIDPAAEARKAAGLRKRLDALRPHAEAVLRACTAAYPEG